MDRWLGRWQEQVYAIFRVVTGALFLMHGLQKVAGMFPDPKHAAPEPWTFLWIGGVLELVCGLMIMLGVEAGWAAFLASGEMAVAYFKVHQPQGALPIQNNGELAVIYSFAFLYIAAKGNGIWALQRRRPV